MLIMDVFQIVEAELNEIILQRKHIDSCFRKIKYTSGMFYLVFFFSRYTENISVFFFTHEIKLFFFLFFFFRSLRRFMVQQELVRVICVES